MGKTKIPDLNQLQRDLLEKSAHQFTEADYKELKSDFDRQLARIKLHLGECQAEVANLRWAQAAVASNVPVSETEVPEAEENNQAVMVGHKPYPRDGNAV